MDATSSLLIAVVRDRPVDAAEAAASGGAIATADLCPLLIIAT